MGIQFAGVDLLLEDPDGGVRDWFDRWLSTKDSRRFVDWSKPLRSESFSGSSAACYTGESLPTLFYSRPQRIKINTWYQPTGCSRWSYGFFIASLTKLNQIVSNLGSGSGGALVLSSTAGDGSKAPGGNQSSTRVFNAYMLPAQSLSANISDPNSLWLIPLVDERWFWQFYAGNVNPVINNTARSNSTWTSFLNSLTGTFGLQSSNFSFDTPPSPYINPNYFVLSGPGSYTVSPIAIDLMLHSVGLRFVPKYPSPAATTVYSGFAWKAVNFTSSKSILTTNLSHQFDLGFLQGGTAALPGANNITPGNVSVQFRSWANGIVLPDWYQTRYQKTIPVGGNPLYFKFFNSTALANFTSGGGVPDNQATLDALAVQIATDFSASLFWIQDSVVVGISQWQESGFDDFIEFSAGYWDRDLDEYVTKTRIHTVPHNFGAETLFHYDPSTWEYGQNIKGTLTGALAPGGNQTITVNGGDSPMTSDAITVRVNSPPGGPSGGLGQTVVAERMANQWIVLGAPGGSSTNDLTGSPTANTLHGNSVNFTLTGGGTQSAFVRKGCVLTTGTYVLAYNGSTYEVANPELLVQAQFSAVTAKNTSVSATLYSGTAGSEASTGLTDNIYIRRGIVVSGKTYDVDWDETGWKVLNPEIVFRGQCGTTTVGKTTATFTVFIGTQGSETTGTTTITGYIRNGVVFANKTYEIDDTDGGYEVRPDIWAIVKNLTGSDIAKGASGTVTIQDGSAVTLTASTPYGIFKNNAIGRAMVDNMNNTLTWRIESTDTC